MRIAAGEGELVDRNVHGHVGGDAVDELVALRAVVVQHVDGGFAGNEGDGTDAPNLEAANVLLAADIGAGEGRDLLAAVTGDHRAQQVKSQDVRLMPGRGLEVLALDDGLDGVDVAAQNAAGEGGGDKQALAAGRRDGMVHGIVRKRGHDAAGANPLQGVRADDSVEIDVIEVGGRGGGLRLHVGDVVAVGDAEAGEAAPQRITHRRREAMSGLDVIQQVLRAERVEQRDQVLSGEDGSLAALVVIEARQVGFHADLQRKIQEVRLREAGGHAAHARTQLRADGKRVAQSQEVVGGVVQAHEAAGDSGDAPIEADGVLAALFDLQGDIHRAGLGVALDVGGFFGFQRLEIA